jgi:hypothetical protein
VSSPGEIVAAIRSALTEYGKWFDEDNLTPDERAAFDNDLANFIATYLPFADQRDEIERLARRIREVDYIVGNEDSLGSEACAALRAVIFDIPDSRRPAIPGAVYIDPADSPSPPSTHTSDGSPGESE